MIVDVQAGPLRPPEPFDRQCDSVGCGVTVTDLFPRSDQPAFFLECPVIHKMRRIVTLSWCEFASDARRIQIIATVWRRCGA
jgi:hypothetical protein